MPDNKSTSQWSSKIEHRNEVPNYIRSESKVINQNEDMPHTERGILCECEDKKYYLLIQDDKLDLSETPAPKGRYVIGNQQVSLDKWIPYSLKISLLGDNMNAYVNGIS